MSGLSKLLVIALLLLLQSCASVTPPNGGPKDITSPKLTTVVPADKSLNYGSKKVVLEFDEEVELRDLQKELIITPYTDNTYETKVSKKTISLEFKNPLLPNTTYTLNFRNAIQDLTEGNKAVLKPITFSTGTYLDSGAISGTVLKHLTNQPEADADILLYRLQDTGTVKTTKPFYVSRTDAAGKYSFTNLATGVYKIYALTDKNNSLTYDQDNERIGYRNDSIVITAKTPTTDLRTIRIDTKKPFIAKRTPKADRAEIEYSEGLTKFIILNQPATADSLIYWISNGQKTVHIHRDSTKQSISFIAQATDSVGITSLDTVSLTFTQKYTARKPELKITNGANYKPGTAIELVTPLMISQINEGAFTIQLDTVTILPVNKTAINIENGGKTIKLQPLNLPKGTSTFILILDSLGLKALTGQYFASFEQTFRIQEEENTGSLSGIISIDHTHYILQLLAANFNVVKEVKNSPKKFEFPNLEPGTYRLRILVDSNNNSRWDNGSADLKEHAEPVLFYPELIEIRANWNLEDIVFSTKKTVDK